MKKLILVLAVMALNSHYLLAQNTVCDDLMEIGRTYYNAGRLAEALESFQIARNINCNEALQWYNRTRARMAEVAPTPRPVQPRVVAPPYQEQLQRGIESFEAGNLQEARILLTNASSLGSTEANEYIAKIDTIEKEQRAAYEEATRLRECSRLIERGSFHLNREEYEMAMIYFSDAENNGCTSAHWRRVEAERRIQARDERNIPPPTPQRFQNALGFKIPGGLSYQRMLNDVNRLELNLRLSSPLNFSGLYQWVFDIDSNWKWYVGVGCGLGMRRYTVDNERQSDFFLNLLGNIGIEYHFDYPFQVAFEYTPALNIVSDFGNFGGGIRLAIRWLF